MAIKWNVKIINSSRRPRRTRTARELQSDFILPQQSSKYGWKWWSVDLTAVCEKLETLIECAWTEKVKLCDILDCLEIMKNRFDIDISMWELWCVKGEDWVVTGKVVICKTYSEETGLTTFEVKLFNLDGSIVDNYEGEREPCDSTRELLEKVCDLIVECETWSTTTTTATHTTEDNTTDLVWSYNGTDLKIDIANDPFNSSTAQPFLDAIEACIRAWWEATISFTDPSGNTWSFVANSVTNISATQNTYWWTWDLGQTESGKIRTATTVCSIESETKRWLQTIWCLDQEILDKLCEIARCKNWFSPKCDEVNKRCVVYDNGLSPWSSSNNGWLRPNFVSKNWKGQLTSFIVNWSETVTTPVDFWWYATRDEQLEALWTFVNENNTDKKAIAETQFFPAPKWRTVKITTYDPDVVYGDITFVREDGIVFKIHPVCPTEEINRFFSYLTICDGVKKMNFCQYSEEWEIIEIAKPERIECSVPCGYRYSEIIWWETECTQKEVTWICQKENEEPLIAIIDICWSDTIINVYTLESYINATAPDQYVSYDWPIIDCETKEDVVFTECDQAPLTRVCFDSKNTTECASEQSIPDADYNSWSSRVVWRPANWFRELIDNRDPNNQVVVASGQWFNAFVADLESKWYTEWSFWETHYICPCPPWLESAWQYFTQMDWNTVKKMFCEPLSELPQAPTKIVEQNKEAILTLGKLDDQILAKLCSNNDLLNKISTLPYHSERLCERIEVENCTVEDKRAFSPLSATSNFGIFNPNTQIENHINKSWLSGTFADGDPFSTVSALSHVAQWNWNETYVNWSAPRIVVYDMWQVITMDCVALRVEEAHWPTNVVFEVSMDGINWTPFTSWPLANNPWGVWYDSEIIESECAGVWQFLRATYTGHSWSADIYAMWEIVIWWALWQLTGQEEYIEFIRNYTCEWISNVTLLWVPYEVKDESNVWSCPTPDNYYEIESLKKLCKIEENQQLILWDWDTGKWDFEILEAEWTTVTVKWDASNVKVADFYAEDWSYIWQSEVSKAVYNIETDTTTLSMASKEVSYAKAKTMKKFI